MFKQDCAICLEQIEQAIANPNNKLNLTTIKAYLQKWVELEIGEVKLVRNCPTCRTDQLASSFYDGICQECMWNK